MASVSAVLVTNWGGASYMDANYQSLINVRQLSQQDNTTAVSNAIDWERDAASEYRNFFKETIYNPNANTWTDAATNWPAILAGAGVGGLLGYMLNDSSYGGYGAKLPRYNCETHEVEVVAGDENPGVSKVVSTVTGAALGGLLAYLAQPTKTLVPDPGSGRDRYIAEMAYKQQVDGLGVRAIGQIGIQIAIDNYIASKQRDLVRSIANDQAALANRSLVMAEKEYCRYTEIFVPCENNTAAEVCADPAYEAQYELHEGRAKLDAARVFGDVLEILPRKFSRYCTGANANLLRQAYTDWARTEVDAVNHAYRYEELQKWRRDDVRFNRRMAVHQLGRNIQTMAVNDMRTGIQGISNANEMLMSGVSGYYGALQSTFGRYSGYLFSKSQSNMATQYGMSYAMASRGAIPTGYYGANAGAGSSLGQPGLSGSGAVDNLMSTGPNSYLDSSSYDRMA